MRLLLAVLFFVVIPEKFHIFSTSSLSFFFLFLSFSGVTFQDQEGLLLPRTLIRHCDGLGRRGKLDSKESMC